MEDAFQTLGLPRSYTLEPEALEVAHQQALLEWHPDLFAQADAATQAKAERLSAAINDAYRQLKDELRRAEHLLTLLHLEAQRSPHPPSPLDARALPAGFLPQSFAWQEELEEACTAARRSPRDAARTAAVDTLAAEFETQWQRHLETLTTQFEKALHARSATNSSTTNSSTTSFVPNSAEDTAALLDPPLQAIQQTLNCLRYFRRLLASIRSFRQETEPEDHAGAPAPGPRVIGGTTARA